MDGYTFPFTATVAGNTLPESICSAVDCSGLTMDQCPTSENLSVGIGGAVNSLYSSLDLNLRSSGPVETTRFVSRVRSMCGGTVYTYAYDDGDGLRQCSAATKVRLTIGPNCP